MIDQDIIQRIKVTGIFLLQSYKILTGTMMSLFIPQSCGDRMCTLTENYNNAELYHRSLFYCNSFSMFLFFCSYLIELRREEWCVKYLDIDNNYSDNGLKKIIIKEPELDKFMDRINRMYYNSLLTTSFVYFVNICMTIKMIDNNYHSNSTISCFMSFTLLVLMKLYNSINIAYKSVHNDKMMSAYMSEFVSYNVLDDDYVLEKYKGTKDNKLEDLSDEKPIKEEEIIPIIKVV
tara:strand:+ start:306 stop:1007 length:702 start_codon:yes stop_codon:yes gene_type:complete